MHAKSKVLPFFLKYLTSNDIRRLIYINLFVRDPKYLYFLCGGETQLPNAALPHVKHA